MTLIDRNFQFLQKCKKLQHQNNLKQLIIPDKYIQPSSLLPYEQIMASQYASAIIDQNINPSCLKNLSNISIPVCLALFSKIIKEGNLNAAEQIIMNILKQNPGGNINKHVLTFNLAKISSLQKNFKKSLLYCESLLIQSGLGSDYYTYQFLRSLIKQKRMDEALNVASRHLQNSNQKHKIQSIFISLISKIYEKDEKNLLRKIEKNFGNRKICIRNYYNLAILLKNRVPQKSLQMFKKLDCYFKRLQIQKCQIMCKINILQIYENNHLSKKYSLSSKLKQKQILEQCQQIINYLQEKIDQNQCLEKRKRKISERLLQIHNQIMKQNNINFFQAINFTSKNSNFISNSPKINFQCDQIMSEAEFSKQNCQEQLNISQSKFYNQKRARNEKRLKFLLKKQKELKDFFSKVKIQRKDQKLNIKLLNNSIINKSSKSKDNIEYQDMLQAEQKFQERKKKFRILYQQGQVNNIINDFIQEWMVPHQNVKTKVKNIQNIKKFVVSLQQQNEIHGNQISDVQNSLTTDNFHLTSRSGFNTTSKRSSSQAFRVKNNTSRKTTDKMFENLKNNDHIANQIINNLKNNVAEKKKQERPNQFQKKNFKQKLHQGQLYEQNNKLEQAHQHYVQMYKRFKEDKQKQILLLKIAQNFENLCFLDQAQKTYIKCTKFNNTQAFFKLGLLQIKCGKIEIGIQNLQKANCIDRHNSKIEIKLVYAYSLLEQTTDRALALANSILKRNPECIQALVMTSKILQKKGKLKQSLDIALAIGNSYGSAPTFHYIGLLYLNDSNVNEAFKYFHKAIQCQSDHLPSLIQLATILSQAKPKQAIDILKNVLSLDPQNQLAFARLGKIYESFENDYENALLVYKKGLQYSPSYQNYVKIGDCHLKLGSVVDAYLNYKQALSIKRTSEIFQKIAEVHEIQHQDKKAIQTYSMALAQLPKDNSSYAQRKKYLFKLGKLSLQGQQFEVAHGYLCEVADMQQSFEVLKMLGQACYGKGDYNEALHYYEQASAMENEDNLELLQNIAMCFDKQEQYLTSKQIYERILSVDPKNVRCLNNLANIFLILGKTNQAFYWFQFMLQQVPTSIQKRIRVSDIYATIGDWSKVEQHLLICYKQKQNDIRVLERMVNLYKEKRDTKQLNKFEKRLTLIKSNNKNS